MHLVVDGRCLHPSMGGIGHATLHLIDHLNRLRHTDDQLTLLVGSQPPDSMLSPGLDIAQVPAGMIDEHFEQHALPHTLDLLKADVYLNMTFSVPAVPGSTAQVAVIHDVVFEDQPYLVEPRLCSYLQRWSRVAAAVAHRVVTVSQHARRRIQDCYQVPDHRIAVIPNGMQPIPTDAATVASHDEVLARLQVRIPYLLYVGSIEPKKGIAFLLAAFAHPSIRNSYAHLVLAGGNAGPHSDLDAAIAQHARHADIRRLGYIPECDKHALMARAHAMVYPSLYEGFGLPPLEALAHGIPCVVNDATSLPEVVGDVGLIVPVQDTEAFAAALHRAAADGDLRAFVRTAGPRHAARFRWDTAATHYWSVCRDAWRERCHEAGT